MAEIRNVPLTADAPNIAEFAQDFAQLGPFTATELAVQYLDQYLDTAAWGLTFDEAVKAFAPSCEDYV